MKAVRKPTIIYQKISTFDESIEAAKIISRAIEDGVLDDAGEVAEITPEEFIIDATTGKLKGVVVTIRASARMAEGVFQKGRFARECFAEGSNVRSLNSPMRRPRRQSSEFIETRMEIPAA